MKREFIGENKRFRKKTKNYVCSNVGEDTYENLNKALKLLTEVTNDEYYYNWEISDATHKMRMELTEIIHQVHENGQRAYKINTNTRG